MIGPFFSPENLISFGSTPQPQPNLPTSVTPITPQPQSNLPIIGMTGAVSTMPQPQQTPNPMGDGKNDKLALMLYALGGALKGDKNFMQNTLALQQMQEGKKKQKELEENWKKALGNLEGLVNPVLFEFAKILGPEKGTSIIASGIEKKEDIPVDIRKLNELRLLRSKFDENSPNYDPTYTKEKYKQEASILGVSSTLFDPSKEKFITDYMKTISTQFKDSLGKPQYTQEEARSMAESMYESIYGIDITTPKNLDKSEDVIDLGTLNEID